MCTHCGQAADEWADITVTSILKDTEVRMKLCPDCTDTMSQVLGVDLEANPDSLVKLSALGILEPIRRDNN